jgi:hypothetical protein
MKIVKYLLLASAIVIIIAIGFFNYQHKPSKDPEFGLTFSHRYAEYLGFDWKTMYLDILNDLKPKSIRLMAYWEDIEPIRGQFSFQQIDEMLIEAEKQGVGVMLVLGHKQPRWPECHHPEWYDLLDQQEKNEAALVMVRTAVEHLRRHGAVRMWQVENEPFFEFGPTCGKIDPELLRRQVAAVKEADERPVILTDSGETGGMWIPTARSGGEYFGSTMYRTVHNPKFGYYQYPLPPLYYRVKAGILQVLVGKEKIIGVELQAEPWFITDVHQTNVSKQLSLMNPKIFNDNINYAKKVGFEENYLWGVEWWYWLAHNHNDWGMWESAKKVITND